MKADKYIKHEIEIIEMESEVIATSPTDLGNKKPANPGAAYSRRRQGFWEDEE